MLGHRSYFIFWRNSPTARAGMLCLLTAQKFWRDKPMPSLLPHLDPDGLLEYSVVFTDRSLNSMSGAFQQVMRDLSALLKEA